MMDYTSFENDYRNLESVSRSFGMVSSHLEAELNSFTFAYGYPFTSTLTKLKTIFCLFFSIEYSTFVSILTTQIAMTIKDFQPHKSGLKNFCHLSKNISQQVTVTNSLRPKNTCSDFSSQTTAI
jgi:hypothetical protein